MNNTPVGSPPPDDPGHLEGPQRRHFAAPEAASGHARLLRALAPVVPVPYVRSVSGCDVVCQPVGGRAGDEVLNPDTAAGVLAECGRVLAKIHRIDPSIALDSDRPGVLVHGDFGPQHLRFASAGLTLRGVVGWEHARTGHAVEDLAWCEWSVRQRHPDCFDALTHLYYGYGVAVPPWRTRQEAMLANCRLMGDLAAKRKDGTATLWRRRSAITAAWPA